MLFWLLPSNSSSESTEFHWHGSVWALYLWPLNWGFGLRTLQMPFVLCTRYCTLRSTGSNEMVLLVETRNGKKDPVGILLTSCIKLHQITWKSFFNCYFPCKPGTPSYCCTPAVSGDCCSNEVFHAWNYFFDGRNREQGQEQMVDNDILILERMKVLFHYGVVYLNCLQVLV